MLQNFHLKNLIPSKGQCLFWACVLALILVPFAIFGAQIEMMARDWLTSTESSWIKAVGIIALLALDTFLPIPSSLVATASGAILGFVQGALAVWLGLNIANIAGYFCGLKWGKPALEKLTGRTTDTSNAHSSVTMTALLLTRAVPVLSESTVIAAGITKLPLPRFLTAIISANLGLALVYAWFGAQAQTQHSFLQVFAASIIIPLIGFGLFKAFKNFNTHQTSKEK